MCPLFGGAGSPSNTVWRGPRPTFTPSFILIHLTVWPQYTNVTDREDRRDRTAARLHRANRFRNGRLKQLGEKLGRCICCSAVTTLCPFRCGVADVRAVPSAVLFLCLVLCFQITSSLVLLLQLRALSEYHVQQLISRVGTNNRRQHAAVGLVYVQKVRQSLTISCYFVTIYRHLNRTVIPSSHRRVDATKLNLTVEFRRVPM